MKVSRPTSPPQRELLTAETAGAVSLALSLIGAATFVLGFILVIVLFRPSEEDRTLAIAPSEAAGVLVFGLTAIAFVLAALLALYAYFIAPSSQNPRRARFKAIASLFVMWGFLFLSMTLGSILLGLRGQ
jgi:hypothetical protein